MPAARRDLPPAPVVGLVLGMLGCLAAACTVVPVGSPDRGTVFGSNLWREPGESRRDALARVDATYGPIGIARVFSEWLPPVWPSLLQDVGTRSLVVSFRVPPERILSGRDDARLASWFAAAPRDRDVYWAYFHEPEDDAEGGDFTPAEFVSAWEHVARLAAAADNPRLHATVVLMCWTADRRSGRDWRHYVPRRGVEVLAWDCYAKGHSAATYADPRALLERARQVSVAVGADWAVAELGARVRPGHEAERARWLTRAGEFAIEHRARFVAYFDAPIGGSFRLLDRPSVRAWAALVRRDPQRKEGRR